MKKILALVLSIAAIFSFVACEAGTVPPVYGKTVVSVTYADSSNYIVGETLNPADVTLRVVYDDGTEATFTGAELGLKPGEGRSTYVLVGTSTQYEVAYGTDKDGAQSEKNTWKINVPAVKYSDTEIALDPSNAAKEVIIDTASLNLSGLNYVVTFKDGTSKTVNPAEIYEPERNWISITDASFVYDFTKEGEVTVELADTVADNVSISPDWVIDVVETPSYDIDFSLVLKDGEEIFEKGSNSLSSLKDKIDVVATVMDFSNVVEAEFTFDDYDESIKVQDYVKSYNVTVTYNGEEYPATFSFEYTPDYPKTVTATPISGIEFRDGDTIEADDFTYTYADWASGASYDKGDEPVDDTYFDVLNAKILKGEQGDEKKARSTSPFLTGLKYNKETVQDVTVTLTSDVTLAKKG